MKETQNFLLIPVLVLISFISLDLIVFGLIGISGQFEINNLFKVLKIEAYIVIWSFVVCTIIRFMEVNVK